MNVANISTAEQQQVIDSIRQGDREQLNRVYVAYREEFVGWAVRSYRCSEEDACDIYQDVIIAFYENVVNNKVKDLKSQLRTYLFGIGKFMILNRFQQQKRQPVVDVNAERQEEIDPVSPEVLWELTDRQRVLKQAIDGLGETCRKLLTLLYYHKYATESVMATMGYNNTNVVKSQKNRCMKSLRTIIKERYQEELGR
ncbi:MAG: sigma-70 family RNA polymerase sigma factor [Bacteroidota bacterium]